MEVSKYETQFTKMHRAGSKNPERNMENKKALNKHIRKAVWEAREAKRKN